MNHSSLYRLKRTYWVHGEDKRICRRLFELEGNSYTLHFSVCWFLLYHTSGINEELNI